MFQGGKQAVGLHYRAVENFFSKNVTDSVEILEGEQEVEVLDQEIAPKAFMHKQENVVTCAICSIRDDIRRIAESAADIAEVPIDRAYKLTT
jgi:hypothetical protein